MIRTIILSHAYQCRAIKLRFLNCYQTTHKLAKQSLAVRNLKRILFLVREKLYIYEFKTAINCFIVSIYCTSIPFAYICYSLFVFIHFLQYTSMKLICIMDQSTACQMVIFNAGTTKALCQTGIKSSRDRYSNASITHCFPEFVFYSIVFIFDAVRGLPSYTGVFVHANSRNNKAMLQFYLQNTVSYIQLYVCIHHRQFSIIINYYRLSSYSAVYYSHDSVSVSVSVLLYPNQQTVS